MTLGPTWLEEVIFEHPYGGLDQHNHKHEVSEVHMQDLESWENMRAIDQRPVRT